MKPITPSRVEELRESVRLDCDAFIPLDEEEAADLLAILSEHAALKAENERLRDRKYHCLSCDGELIPFPKLWARVEKAEAQLARQAPLVEAAMANRWDGEPILRAALKLRSEK